MSVRKPEAKKLASWNSQPWNTGDRKGNCQGKRIPEMGINVLRMSDLTKKVTRKLSRGIPVNPNSCGDSCAGFEI